MPAPTVTIVVAAARQQEMPREDGTEWILEPAVAGDLAQAWNRGARRGRGELLLFLRDTASAGRETIGDHVELHRLHSRALGLSTGPGEHGTGDVRPLDFCGGACSIRRTEFVEAGGFIEGLQWGAEVELAHRLAARGVRLLRAGGELDLAPHPAGVRTLAAERAAAGRGSVALYRLKPALLPELELARFGDGAPRAAMLQRMLLAIGAPLWPVRVAARLVPRRRRSSWQRFVHSYLYWRGVWQAVTDRDTRARLVHAPLILMYHAIGAPGERAGRYIVPVRRFSAHLRWLRLAGYRVLGLEEILESRRAYRLPPAGAVALTFDDGYLDNHRVALPVLRRHAARATFFLVSGRVGDANRWDRTGDLAGRPLMSWADIADLVQSGMEIGAHSRSHPALPGLPDEAREKEVQGSRADLEARLGGPVRTFAYPYGLFDEATVHAAEQAGFDAACSAHSGANGPAVPAFLLRRLEIRGTDTLVEFALAVWRRSRRRHRRAQ